MLALIENYPTNRNWPLLTDSTSPVETHRAVFMCLRVGDQL